VGTAHDLEVRPTQATSSSFGFMDRRQQLSFDSGVVLSDGKTQAPSPVEMASARQASISRNTPSATAASRIDRPVFGLSTIPRYTRWPNAAKSRQSGSSQGEDFTWTHPDYDRKLRDQPFPLIENAEMIDDRE